MAILGHLFLNIFMNNLFLTIEKLTYVTTLMIIHFLLRVMMQALSLVR